MRIGILGSGVVGPALARGYARHGHEVRIGTRQAEVDGLPTGTPQEVAAEAELVVLAVRGDAVVLGWVIGLAPCALVVVELLRR